MAKKNIKRLYRAAQKDSMIAGVCAGIAEYTDSDPTLIRLVCAALTVFTGVVPGILVYLLAWIIVPQK